MIVCGCVSFAKHVGSVRLEAELLPQCWEQITYKYHERRLLVAECCGALAPYIPVSERDINCGFCEFTIGSFLYMSISPNLMCELLEVLTFVFTADGIVTD